MPAINYTSLTTLAEDKSTTDLCLLALQLKAVEVLQETQGSVVNTLSGLNKRQDLAIRVLHNNAKEESITLAKLIMNIADPAYFTYSISPTDIKTSYLDGVGFGMDTWNILSGVLQSEL